MKSNRLLLIVMIVLVPLSGCTSVATLHRDSTGKIWKVETRGEANTIIKQDGEEIQQDTKREPLLNIELPLNKVGL